MAKRKRKKVVKLRGSKTHSHGSKKKARGKGSKGGKGRAGMGKKAKHKRFLRLRERKLEKGGFYSVNRKKIKAVNLGYIEEKFDYLLKMGVIEKKNNKYVFHAEKLGYEKILGAGNIRGNMELRAKSFSSKAVEKIKSANSEAVVENG